jgi:adenosine kinase
LSDVLQYTDIVIANEAEAESWAVANKIPNPTDLPEVAKAVAALPKANKSRRVVVFTHGPKSTVLVTSDNLENPKTYPVHALTDDEIVDTNGAGDAFAGGFIGAYVLGKSLDECVAAGHKMGTMCVTLVSCYFLVARYQVLIAYPRWGLNTNGQRFRSFK